MSDLFKFTVVDDAGNNRFRLPPFITQDVLDDVSNKFYINDDDIIITTYPRSGTTWMQQIVHLLLNKGVQGERHLEICIPYIERAAALKGIDIFSTMEGRRAFKTHLPFTSDLYRKNSKAKFIYVVRNPMDCAVSNYFFYLNNYKITFHGNWDDFYNLFVNGDLFYGSWFDHVSEWWEKSKIKDNILFIKYEDIHLDLSNIINRIADFIDITLTEDILNQIVSKTSFDYMKKDSKTNLSWGAWKKNSTESPLRKGTVGDWKTLFNPKQIDILKNEYNKKIKKIGLELNFMY